MRERLRTIMTHVHDHCFEAADEYGVPDDYVLGANLGGSVRVAESMRALGIV